MPSALVPAHERFLAQAERVEAARRALLRCLPVGRVHPVPVAVGLDLVEDEVRAVVGELDAWRRPEVDAAWQTVREACAESLGAVAEAHRVAASTTELEHLLAAVGEVVEPLDAWAEAERTWLALRTPARAPDTKRPRRPRPPRPVRDWTPPNDAGPRR